MVLVLLVILYKVGLSYDLLVAGDEHQMIMFSLLVVWADHHCEWWNIESCRQIHMSSQYSISRNMRISDGVANRIAKASAAFAKLSEKV